MSWPPVDHSMASSSKSPTSQGASGSSRQSSSFNLARLKTEFSRSPNSSVVASSRSSVSQQPSRDGFRKPEPSYFASDHPPWNQAYSAQTSPTYASSYASGISSHTSQGQYYSMSTSNSPAFATPLLPSQSMAGGGEHNDDSPASHYSRQSDGGQEALKPVSPTWYGWVEYTEDALRLIEACIIHRLKRIQRRPDENERPRIIQNGAVFVFDETTTGILRWTDDRNWSPSRVRGSFMLYRELDSKVLPGEKKKALKKQKTASSELSMPTHRSTGDKSRREDESSVRGSHTDSYPYKMDAGLMKRTFSAYYGDTKWSVISYYDPDAVEAGMLPRVSDDPNLKDVHPRQEIVGKVLQGSVSSGSKNDRQTGFATNRLPQTSHEYEHVYGPHYQQATTSYPTPPTTAVSPSHMNYAQTTQHSASSYDYPSTPVYPPSSYSGPMPQSQGHTISSQPTHQYNLNFQINPNEPPPGMYHMPPPLSHQQPGPVMDPRSFQERAAQERRDSFAQQTHTTKNQYRQSSYHHDQSPGFPPSRPDVRRLEEQQQNYSAWHAHDQTRFPPPPNARPN